MDHTAALEPDPVVALSEITGEPRHLVQRAAWLFVETLRTKRGDISMDSVAAKGHSWHMTII